MITVKWQVQAASISDEDVAIMVPRLGGKTFALAWIAAMDAIIQKRDVVFTSNRVENLSYALNETLNVIETLGFSDQVKQTTYGNGNRRITMVNGARIVFMARSIGVGRGFHADTLIVDEADELTGEQFADMLPALMKSGQSRVVMAGIGTRPNDTFEQFYLNTNKRFRTSLGSVDWNALDEVEVWKEANPLIGELIPVENVERMRDYMLGATFAAEVLGAVVD